MVTRKATAKEVQQGLFKEKDEEELLKLIGMGAIHPEERPSDPRAAAFPLIPIRTVTEIEGVITKCKTRFTADGRRDPREVNCFKELPGKAIVRMGLQYAISRNYEIALADITAAYLHAEAPDGLNIILPHDLPESAARLGFRGGGKYTMRKAVYGVKDSGKRFIEFMEKTLATEGFDMITEGLFRKDSELVIVYVDDLLVISTEPVKLLEVIRQHVKIDSHQLVRMGEKYKYLGFELARDERGVEISIKGYLQSKNILPEHLHPLTKGDIKQIETTETVPMNAAQLSKAREIVGVMGWAAQHNHQAAFLFSFMASASLRLGEKAEHYLLRATKRMMTLEDETITPLTSPEIRIYADASLQYTKGKGRGGWILQLTNKDHPIGGKGNVLAWKSFPLSRLHGSTASAELTSLLKAVQDTSRLVSWIREIWGEMEVVIYGDSVPCLTQAHEGRATGGGPSDVEARLVAQEIGFRKWNVRYVRTTENLADHLTKMIY